MSHPAPALTTAPEKPHAPLPARSAQPARKAPNAADGRGDFLLNLGLWLLLALAFRLAALPGGSIWFDELYSVKIATFSPAQIQDWIRFDTHPALYYLLVHYFMRLGQWLGPACVSLPWLRLSAVLPSLATCAILAAWAWQALGRRAGLSVLALAAVSPGLCFYAQELRNYALAIMFVTLAGYALVRLLRKPTAANALLYVAASLGFLYSHNLTIVVLGGNFAWALLYPRLAGSAVGLRLRAAVYGTFLAILILALPQLRQAVDQFGGQYQPIANLLPETHGYDLLTTFFYDFPAGPVETQGWGTPYGVIVVYLHAAFFVLLLANLWRSRRRLKALPPMRPTLGYCGFMLLFFLGSTWAATMLDLGKLYYSYRTAMIVLPLWLLAMVLLIEIIPRTYTRRWLRLGLLALTIPSCFLSLDYRNAYRSDFRFIVERNIQLDKPGPLQERDYYLTDEQLAPWIRQPAPGMRFAGLSQMLAEGQGGKVLLVNSIMERLQTDREIFADAFVRRWADDHKHPPDFAEFMNPVYDVPAAEAKAFGTELEARWQRISRDVVRGPDRLVLLPFCQEFNNSRGFYPPELDQGQAYRWTKGPQQQLAWHAPERPGRYQVRLLFWWPKPVPAPHMTVEYRIGGGQGAFKTLRVAPGSVVVQETVETRTKYEPLTLEMFSDYYVPALWDHSAKDERKLGLMFTRLEMTPVKGARK